MVLVLCADIGILTVDVAKIVSLNLPNTSDKLKIFLRALNTAVKKLLSV